MRTQNLSIPILTFINAMTSPIRALFIILCILAASTSVQAQSSTNSVEKDEALLKIRAELPEGWKIYFEGSSLNIERVVEISGKLIEIDEPVGDYGPPAANAAAQGPIKKTMSYSKVSFSLSNTRRLMSRDDWNKYEAENLKIDAIIDTLHNGYEHTKLPGKSEVRPMIHFESKEVRAAYDAARRILEQKKKSLPLYYSQTYCYKWKSRTDLGSSYEWQPAAALQEYKVVYDLIEKYIGCYFD